MFKKILNDEHIKQASQVAVIAFFAAFVIEIANAIAFGGEAHYVPYHALMGAGIGSYFFRFGKKGIVYAIIVATAFNITWEIFESVIGWTQLASSDTAVDIAAVYSSMVAGLGIEKFRKASQ